MANLQERRDKSGKLISYSIRVHRGRGADGRQLKPWTCTFNVSPTWSEKTARKKAEAFAATFEKECREGVTSDSRKKLGEYINYVISLKERTGLKHTTITFYQALAGRIIPELGHIQLKDLRADHLNVFYENLGKPGSGKGRTRATAKIDLSALLKEKRVTRKEIAEKSKIPLNTIYAVVKGKPVSIETAAVVADALGMGVNKVFAIEKNTSTLSSKSILEHHRFIHTVLEQAVKEGLIPLNVADRATPPKLIKKEVDHYEPQEIKAIVQALETEPIRWKVFVFLLLTTGCRRGELLGLSWDKIDFTQNQIYICQTVMYRPDIGIYIETPKTEKSIRYIALPLETMSLLKSYQSWQALEKERLGHSLVSTTMDVYSHVLEKADRESADVLGAIVYG